jgi:hypothetical protein
MDISRTIKDVILITPWLLCLLTYSVTLGFIHLFLLIISKIISKLIFIYERTGDLLWQKRQ